MARDLTTRRLRAVSRALLAWCSALVIAWPLSWLLGWAGLPSFFLLAIVFACTSATVTHFFARRDLGVEVIPTTIASGLIAGACLGAWDVWLLMDVFNHIDRSVSVSAWILVLPVGVAVGACSLAVAAYVGTRAGTRVTGMPSPTR